MTHSLSFILPFIHSLSLIISFIYYHLFLNLRLHSSILQLTNKGFRNAETIAKLMEMTQEYLLSLKHNAINLIRRRQIQVDLGSGGDKSK